MAGRPCCMCGKRTPNRCSKCASESGYQIFFCSPAHQKLLWPVHSQICGRRANPFTFPPFSKAEADDLIQSRHEPSLHSTSLSSLYKEDWGIDDENLPKLIDSLRRSYKGDPIFPRDTTQKMIF
ncbi:hypothetical protein JCM5353_002810 [Sporobolomyces roseus]